EVKCWDGFTGMAFSPDSTQVLLRKEHALYIGKIAGVRPEPPVKVIDNVDGAATWTPGPVGAPAPAGVAGKGPTPTPRCRASTRRRRRSGPTRPASPASTPSSRRT